MLRYIPLLLTLLLFGCDRPQSGSTTLPLEPCVLEASGLRAQCGTLAVPEDRANPDGRSIELNIAVVESLAEEPKPDPLVILVGGPGQSGTRSGAPLAKVFREVRKRRNILLVDQRGTGKSNPLKCAREDTPLKDALKASFDAQEFRNCLDEIDADTRHYTTPVAMDDLDAVREALGYDKLNLWGGSYGTRAALVYMRRHPEHTRRVILDGVAPTDIKLTVHAGRDAQRALDLMFDRCDADADCSARFGSLRAKFDLVMQELADTGPREVEIRHPRTGKVEPLLIEPDVFAAMVRGILYAPMLVATLPLGLEAAAEGDFEPLLAALLTIQDNVDADMADGMFLSVVCAEDVPQITPDEVAKFSTNFLGRTPVELLMQSCEVWPAAKMPPEYFEPVTEAHPTLVLSGELDPVTPPSWGELVASQLQNAKHVAVDGLGHGVSAMPCATKAIAEFLDAPDPMAVEVQCDAKDISPFLLTPAGPVR